MKKSALILGAVMLPLTTAYAQGDDDAMAADSGMEQPADAQTDQNAPAEDDFGTQDDAEQSSFDDADDDFGTQEDAEQSSFDDAEEDFDDSEEFDESGEADFDNDGADSGDDEHTSFEGEAEYDDTMWGRTKETLARIAVPADKTYGPGYTYAEGQYMPEAKAHGIGEDTHGGNEDHTDGYGGDISWAGYTSFGSFHPIIQGGWHRYNIDKHNGLALNDSYVGVGGQTFFKTPYMNGTGIGFYATVNWERLEARNMTNGSGGRVGTATADGWGIHTGLRWMPLPFLEVNPHAKYRDFGSFAKNGRDLGKPHGFDYGLKLLGYVDDDQHFALTADYTRSDMGIGGDGLNGDGRKVKMRNQIKVGARFTF